MRIQTNLSPSRSRSGFNIIEAVIAMAVSGIMFVALYSGISSSFFNVRLARENLRATQILVEKMEVIRLLTWDQINSNGFVVTTFSAPLSPSAGSAAFFNGNIDIKPVAGPDPGGSEPGSGPGSGPGGGPGKGKPGSGGGGTEPPIEGDELSANYTGDLRIVTVTLSWKTGGLQRSRQLSTYISRFGVQNYVFN